MQNEGGLDYKLNVIGDFDAVLDRFEKRIDALSAKAKTLKAPAQGSGQTDTSSASLKNTSQEAIVLKKIQAMDREIYLLNQRSVTLKKAELDLTRKAEALIRRTTTTEGKLLAQAERRVVSQKEQYRQAVLLNKQNTQAIDNKALNEAAVLRKDMLSRAKEQQKIDEANQKRQQALLVSKQKEAAYNNIDLQASNRLAHNSRELAIKQAQINQLTANGAMTQRKAAEQIGVSSSQAKTLGLHMWDAEHAARQFLFTFRRLVGILAIFTLARQLASSIAGAVREMSDFNETLETAQIGMASIIASVGQLRDGQGDLLTGSDAFSAALLHADGVVNQLKKDALGSIATFEALIRAYQTAVGPGLAAGLDLEQIRTLSKRLAEAAITMGLPINQLSEEIRSLLQGTATARNTRLAVLFGGAKEANEAVKNAKEQGNLYEVLTEKLDGVKQGSDAASLSMAVLKSNLQDAVQLLLAQGGIEQFNSLKDSILALKNALSGVDATGNIIFSPAALGIVQEVAGTLASITTSFRAVTDTGQVLTLIRTLLANIGDVLKTLAPIVSAVFQGIITGVNMVLVPLRTVLDLFRSLARILGLQDANIGLANILKYLVAGVVALVAWQKLLVFIQGLLVSKGLVGGFSAILAAVESIALILKTNGIRLLSINALTVIWGQLTATVALRTALATGGLTIVLATLALIVTKTKLWENITGKFNNKIDDSGKSMKDLESTVRGVLGDFGDANIELKNMKTKIKSLEREISVANMLSGVEGVTKEILELYLARNLAIKDVTKQEEKSIANSNKTLTALQKQLHVLDQYIVTNAKREYYEEAIILAAQRRLEIFKEESKEHANIKAQEESRLSKINEVNKLYQAQIDKLQAARDEQRLLNTLEIERITAAGKLEESQKRRQSADLAEQVQARIKVQLLNEQAKVLETQYKNTTALIEESKKEADTRAAGLTQASQKVDELQKALDELSKPQEVSVTVERNKIKADIQKIQDELEAGGFSLALTPSGIKKTSELFKQRRALELDLQKLESEGTTEQLEAAKEAHDRSVASAKVQLASAKAVLTNSQIAAKEQAILDQERVESLERLGNQYNEIMADALDAQKEYEKRSLAASNSFVDGVRLGLIEFTDAAGTFSTKISEVTTSALSSLSSTVADVFMDAIDPTENMDIREAFGEFFLDLAGQFVEAVTSQFIQMSLLKLGLGGTQDLAITANTTALGLNTTALQVLSAQLAAQRASGAVTAPLSTFKKGGLVPKGYASGGTIESIPRPASIPASDTVPAWLTPNEYILTPRMVDQVGLGALEQWRKGMRIPSSFGAASRYMRGTSPVAGFASGGPVRATKTSAGGSGTSRTIVLPVVTANDTTVDQMLSGGRKAFSQKLNKAKIVGDPNASRRW